MDTIIPMIQMMETFDLRTDRAHIIDDWGSVIKLGKKNLWTLLTKEPVRSWSNFSSSALSDTHWVCFKHYLLGSSFRGMLYQDQLKKNNFNREPLLRTVRAHMLHMVELDPKPAANCHTPFITVWCNTHGRNITNIDEVVSALSSKYGTGNVLKFTPDGFTMQEQAMIMQKTSVFICHYGGGSHIMMFLPPGSAVLYVGDDLFTINPNTWWIVPVGGDDHYFGVTEQRKIWNFLPDVFFVNYRFGQVPLPTRIGNNVSLAGEISKEHLAEWNVKQEWKMTLSPDKTVMYVDSAVAHCASWTV